MSSNEFDIIRRYFKFDNTRDDVSLSVGDDCALLVPRPGKVLATTVDTLISGIHFPEKTAAVDIASKVIAVNISDLAAMGAEPAWVTLALTLPGADENWLEDFSREFHRITQSYGVQLVGGDTTRGPLSITVQATGYVYPERAMRRDSAKPGDNIYVTGTIGDAALALRLYQSGLLDKENLDDANYLLSRLNRPEPRLEFALAVSEYSHCAIDISDGLLADLGHIITASRCGARIDLENLPLSTPLLNVYKNNGEEADLHNVLSGGDDYELCFTVNPDLDHYILALGEQLNLPVTKIGVITDTGNIECLDQLGHAVNFMDTGYQHF